MDSKKGVLERVPPVGSAADPAALLSHMLHNEPCVLQIQSNEWRVAKEFVSMDGTLDVTAFKHVFGDYEIPVDINSASYSSQRLTTSVSELLDRMMAGECVYGKDWHFQLMQRCSDAPLSICTPLFELPMAVRDDWLNWFCDIRGNDDFRFLYIGGPDTRTELHYDVLFSYSWSVNIVGRKLWRFWDPVKIDCADGMTEVSLIASGHAPSVTFIQEPNQLVFVPSGWYHTVMNLGATPSPYGQITASINHNWMNGFNIYRVWRFVVCELGSVQAEMACFRKPTVDSTDPTLMAETEWSQHCELTMRANSSFSVLDFFAMLSGRLLHVLHQEYMQQRTRNAFIVPAWGRTLCGKMCEDIVRNSSLCPDYIDSCNAFSLDLLGEGAVACGGKPELLHCSAVRREDALVAMGLNVEVLSSKLSVSAFGVLESCRVILECVGSPMLLLHVSINLGITAHGVMSLFHDMLSAGARYISLNH